MPAPSGIFNGVTNAARRRRAHREQRMKVVWVIGAGFSASLGVPLLDGLFRPPWHQRILGQPRTSNDLITRAYRLFNAGPLPNEEFKRGLHEGPTPVVWKDAEEFLEICDLAAVNLSGEPKDLRTIDETIRDEARRTIDAVNGKPENGIEYETVARRARHWIAAACDLAQVDGMSINALERWHPYVAWAQKLDAADTVISFNYDHVPMLAADAAKKRLLVPSPENGFKTDATAAKILMLHGSVSWARHRERRDANWECGYDRSRTGNADWDFLIAAPGLSKRSLALGFLKPLWTAAAEALTEADVVVFVGYRFPQSDAHAKATLLNALTKNKSSRGLTIRSVLGADVNHRDVNRLAGMLRWATGCLESKPGERFDRHRPHKVLIREPLFAEDFLTVFEREQLSAYPG